VNRAAAAAGTFVFFWIAPATVAGLVPWLITHWHAGPQLFAGAASRGLGVLLAVSGLAIVIECFVRFARKGAGTPAPIAPTERLVVSGLYRHVRNPMYVGVVSAIIGQALGFGSSALLYYGLAVWAGFFAFVVLVEEPSLARRFGAEYEAYRAAVPRWLPRFTPWREP
jgi:protein-S-isoprenylcysteine O-methyltransferase Ste14